LELGSVVTKQTGPEGGSVLINPEGSWLPNPEDLLAGCLAAFVAVAH